MLPPLKPGQHVLNLHGAGCVETEEGIDKVFETEVTYHLTVVRRPKDDDDDDDDEDDD